MSSEPKPRIMKPSQIPIYGFPEEASKKPESQIIEEPGYLKSGISAVRVGFQDLIAPFKGLDEQISHIYETGKAHSQSKT